MAKLTNQEVLDELAKLYQAKQDLAALDLSLNTQSSAITLQAQTDIANLRVAQVAARATAAAALQTAEDKLNKGK